VLRASQLGDAPAAIADYDDLMEIAARPLPLVTHMTLMITMLAQRRQWR
jgi:hypothetical protein